MKFLRVKTAMFLILSSFNVLAKNESMSYADIVKCAQNVKAHHWLSRLNNPQEIIALLNSLPYTANALSLARLLQKFPYSSIMHDPEIQKWINHAQSQLQGGAELIQAIEDGNIELFENLLSNKNIDLNFKAPFKIPKETSEWASSSNEMAWCPLITAIITPGIIFTQRLLDAGADVTIIKDYGVLRSQWPPLMEACLFGRSDLLEALITAGSDFNYQDAGHFTPLMLAIGSFLPVDVETRSEMAKILIAYGARTDIKDKEGRTARDIAVYHHYTQVVETLDELTAP